MAMGTPIALVGIIIMAINTGTVSGTGSGTVGEKGTGTGSGSRRETWTGIGIRKEYTSHQLSPTCSNSNSDTTPHPSQTIIKIVTNTRKDKEKNKNEMSDFRINQNTDSNISISIEKENEQYVDQSMVETGRSRRHLGETFQFSKSSYRAGKEVVEVI